MNAALSKTKTGNKAAPQTGTPTGSKADTKSSAVQVIESGSCPTLTGKSTLGYDVGRDADSTLYLRIRSNSGHGKFNKHWIGLKDLMDALEKARLPITCATFQSVCRHKSANQSGFLLSVFLAKGLVQRLPDRQRGYAIGPSFTAGAKQLTKPAASGASAKPLKAKAVAKTKSK